MANRLLLLLLVGCASKAPMTVPSTSSAPRPVDTVPSDAASWYLKAVVAAERGDRPEAERAMSWVVRLDRANPWAWMAQGSLYEQWDDLPAALAAYSQAALRTQQPEVLLARDRVRATLCDSNEVEPNGTDWGCAREGEP